MKKIVLSLAGVMAAVAFAPEASAVPVFARQTGMACSACHFQHPSLLNGFGRAFKAAGYTMMGAQGKVEGEHLSIPANLNMGVLATAGIEKQSGASSNTFVPGTGGELQIFFGGRVGEYAGFISEFATAPAGAASAKLSIMPEVTSGIHAGLTFFSAGQGAAGSFEMLNTGATSIHRMMANTGPAQEHIRAVSARQYVANEKVGAGGTGVSLNVAGDNFAASFAKETNVSPGQAGGTAFVGLPFKYLRAVGLFDVAGWDTGVGIQSFSGTGTDAQTVLAVPAIAGAQMSRRATVIDGQMQGAMGGMPVGLYASYGRAPGSVGVRNEFNANAGTASSFNISGELGVMPGATLQLALRSAKNGALINDKDNAIMIGASYDLAQNILMYLNYTTQSGSAWNGVLVGKNATTLVLETLF